jgi:large subunit ribosomal protein L22
MAFKSISKHVRISPLKARQVADLVRGENAELAKNKLEAYNKKAADLLLKTLNSAIANAKHKEAETKDLIISEIFVDQGPIIKRHRMKARGRIAPIAKRTSHLTIILDNNDNLDQSENNKKEKNGSKS